MRENPGLYDEPQYWRGQFNMLFDRYHLLQLHLQNVEDEASDWKQIAEARALEIGRLHAALRGARSEEGE